jgi:hypothetical protein
VVSASAGLAGKFGSLQFFVGRFCCDRLVFIDQINKILIYLVI